MAKVMANVRLTETYEMSEYQGTIYFGSQIATYTRHIYSSLLHNFTVKERRKKSLKVR